MNTFRVMWKMNDDYIAQSHIKYSIKRINKEDNCAGEKQI